MTETATIANMLGSEVSLEELRRLVLDAEPSITRALTDYGRNVGAALAGFVSLFNPDTVVLDGRLGDAAAPVLEGVRETIELRTSPLMRQNLSIVTGSLGEAALPYGGFALARQARLNAYLGSGAHRPGTSLTLVS